MLKIILNLFLCLSIAGCANSQLNAEKPITIYLAGDSTMQDVDPVSGPDFGWGQLLPTLVNPNWPTVVSNHAKGGRSTKTFLSEGRWQAILDNVKPDDYVLIQFGHNDASYEKPERYTAPVDYKQNLIRFVSEIKAKQAKPILITPVMRRYFDTEGKLKDAHGIYPSLAREAAAETQTPLIDLFKSSCALLLKYGPDESAVLFMSVEPGEHPRYPEGKIDKTHFSKFGALEVAKLVVTEIQQQNIQPLAQLFQPQ